MEMNTYEKEHSALMRRAGAECALFLKRGSGFPLDAPCEVALYGSGARNTLKGGTGSGDVNSRCFVTVEQALQGAGFTVTTKDWLTAYEEERGAARRKFIKQIKTEARKNHRNAIMEGMGAVMPEPEYDIPLNGSGHTAIYVLSRISGEGSDRSPVPGDILLSRTEVRDILALQNQYQKFMLVLNVGGVVDLSPVLNVENILLLSQLGVETGNVLADILLGKANPSGKLSATWSAWRDYPTIGAFGCFDDTPYTEGVYVGYRYFDSVGKKPLFPFGFGLSYTEFTVRPGTVTLDGETVTVTAAVTNTGSRAGREVVQIYVSSPAGKLDKPYQALAAFAKTRTLEPGETEEVTMNFKLRELASYDEDMSAWVLERGDYILRVGSSSADTVPTAILRLENDAVTVQARSCFGKTGFTDWKPECPAVAEAPDGLYVLQIPAGDIVTQTVAYDVTRPIDPAIDDLTDNELAYMSVGAFDPKAGVLSVIGNASQSVAGAAGETCGMLKDKGIPVIVMADGPAGLRLSRDYTVDAKGVHPIGQTMPDGIIDFMPAPVRWFMNRSGSRVKPGTDVRRQYCTAMPIGTALAQSWDLELAEQCGDIVGDEMERFGVRLWLAPALNIQRDIRCGRNFEYYSEDPLLSGKLAAAVTRGVQKHPGRAVTIKHFAANNQETNRYSNNSQVSERALREIYLRGFGVCVTEGQPKALMTSYNLINGVHTSEHRELIEDILRCEFGFDGVVMTDWIVSIGMQSKEAVHPAPNAGRIAAAGNDLTMPGCNDDYRAIMKALADGTLTREQLAINVSRIYRLAKALAED
uniref:Beta-glucosidase-related glycosidases n=1 Tax=uncultured bacterium scaffold00056 TaxID=1132475 RepID=I7ARK7_9BACT|nr:beta-glucosidase-related glycosidases [uncultured bacterium scaffold00056]